MRKISSKTTYFRKKIIPVITLGGFVLVLICVIIFEVPFRDLTIIFFPSIIFFFVWVFRFKRLSEVYIDNKFFIVNGKKINIENIISINNIGVFNYKVTYRDDNKEGVFYYMIDFLPYTDPMYIKDIKEKIKNKNLNL